MGVTKLPDGLLAEGFRVRAGTIVTVAPFSAGTVDTGLGAAPLVAVGNISVAGTGASHCTAGTAHGSSGSVIFNVYGTAAAAASVAATIHYIAIGTA